MDWCFVVLQFSLPFFCFARTSQCMCVVCMQFFFWFANRSETRTKKFTKKTSNNKNEEQSDASTCEANKTEKRSFFDGRNTAQKSKQNGKNGKKCAYY